MLQFMAFEWLSLLAPEPMTSEFILATVKPFIVGGCVGLVLLGAAQYGLRACLAKRSGAQSQLAFKTDSPVKAKNHIKRSLTSKQFLSKSASVKNRKSRLMRKKIIFASAISVGKKSKNKWINYEVEESDILEHVEPLAKVAPKTSDIETPSKSKARKFIKTTQSQSLVKGINFGKMPTEKHWIPAGIGSIPRQIPPLAKAKSCNPVAREKEVDKKLHIPAKSLSPPLHALTIQPSPIKCKYIQKNTNKSATGKKTMRTFLKNSAADLQKKDAIVKRRAISMRPPKGDGC